MATEIIDGAYDITLKSDPRRYRAYLIDADVPTLFDAGFPDTTEELFDGVDEVGLEPERVIVTHEDHDHVGGLEEVVETYDVESWAPADDADVIAEEYGVEVDNRYEHGDHIGPYEVVHVPGHTPGVSVLVHAAADYAVLGDVLWGADERGLPVGYFIPPPEGYTDDPAAAELNLDRLLGHDFSAGLVFHGSAVTDGASRKIERFVDFPGSPD